jgi:hypothetical protein
LGGGIASTGIKAKLRDSDEGSSPHTLACPLPFTPSLACPLPFTPSPARSPHTLASLPHGRPFPGHRGVARVLLHVPCRAPPQAGELLARAGGGRAAGGGWRGEAHLGRDDEHTDANLRGRETEAETGEGGRDWRAALGEGWQEPVPRGRTAPSSSQRLIYDVRSHH